MKFSAIILVCASFLVGAYIGILKAAHKCEEVNAAQLAHQELYLFERSAESNYGLMKVWAEGTTVKEAIEAIEAKGQILTNNGWSIIGNVEQEQSVGIITLSRTAFRLP